MDYPSYYPEGLVRTLSELEKWAPPPPKGPAGPPDLRGAETTEECCGACQDFSPIPGKAWKGVGRCVTFKCEVAHEHLCDEFRSK